MYLNFSKVDLQFLSQEMDGLPTYITLLLYVIVFVAPGLLIAIVIICFVSGLCLLIYSTTNLLIAEGWLKLSSKVQGKYSSIQITPMINKSSIINIYQGRSQLCLPLTWPTAKQSLFSLCIQFIELLKGGLNYAIKYVLVYSSDTEFCTLSFYSRRS